MSSIPTYTDLQIRKKLLLEELNATQAQIATTSGFDGAIDIHHPERSPGWPQYRYQPYPKMLYHPIKLNPDVEAKRLGIRRRNEANPTLAPLDLPPSQPLTTVVHNEEEKGRFQEQGWLLAPPMLKSDEEMESFDPLSNPNLMTKDGLCGRGCGKAPHKGRCAVSQ